MIHLGPDGGCCTSSFHICGRMGLLFQGNHAQKSGGLQKEEKAPSSFCLGQGFPDLPWAYVDKEENQRVMIKWRKGISVHEVSQCGEKGRGWCKNSSRNSIFCVKELKLEQHLQGPQLSNTCTPGERQPWARPHFYNSP